MQVKKTISSDVNIVESSNVSDNKNKGKAKSKGNKMTRTISIVAILLLILGLSLFKIGALPLDRLNYDSLNKFVGNNTEELPESQSEESNSQIDQINEVLEKANNPNEHKKSQLSDDSQQAIAALAPLSEGDGDDQEEILNPYELELGKIEYAPTIQKHIVIKNATQYRMFLLNARRMIEKFEKGEVYDSELRTFQMRVVPEEINEIIEKFSAYNEMLKDEKLKPYKKIDLGYKFFDRFLKIKEVNEDYIIVDELKKEIQAEMPMFNKFLHSDRLQAEFFGK